MKTHRAFSVGSTLLALATGCAPVALIAPALVLAAAPKSDLVPSQKRQGTVESGEKLSQQKNPEKLPATLRSPFNPPDFDKPEGGDAAPTTPRPAGTPAPTPPPRPAVATDRETLESLAAQITPSGSFRMGGKSLLVIGGKRFEVGTKFTATYKDQDYELELIAIEPSTFTLRYRNEEITRPIKPR